jgi:hypothetical protein
MRRDARKFKAIAMRTVRRVFIHGPIVIVTLAGALGALFWTFVYTPAPEMPQLWQALLKCNQVSRRRH